MDQQQALEQIHNVRQNMQKIMVGKDAAVNLLLIALLSKGHALLEDVPGIGKTTMVYSLSKSLACSFARIQFTPDVMPSDITGFSIFNIRTTAAICPFVTVSPGATFSESSMPSTGDLIFFNRHLLSASFS